MEITDILAEGFVRLGMQVTDGQLAALCLYARRLVEYNQKVNLTAITEPAEIARKHFLDCAACAPLIKTGASCADVGTGAGFPGMVLAIVRPDLHLTLFDSLNKRLVFLQQLAQELDIKVDCVHARAEEAGVNPLYRERFDVVVSRAVARMSVLAELTLPFVRVGGELIALKGPDALAELKDGKRAISILGGAETRLLQSNAFEGQQHNFVIIKKRKPTPKGYPRKAGTPAKDPIL